MFCCVLDLHLCFNFDKKNYKIFHGSIDAQFGYTVQQHEAGGHQWLLVGAPFEYTGQLQTGDVYKCPLDIKSSANCSRLDLVACSRIEKEVQLGTVFCSWIPMALCKISAVTPPSWDWP
ncbi:hypothetical protein ILYODFUR_018841 [Ilyodon furcidens]|uniref:Uncharacterized protein n=1 Tax=Ilyodon furcidens TaxID=33524 RepID=A0ABV0TD33_9TELE